MFHRSERLLLRPVWPEDWQAVYGGIADEDVVRNLARAPWPYSKRDAREFAARVPAPTEPRFLITTARDGQVVGCIGIDSHKEHPEAVELGYWVARSYWGQGIATEAGRAVIEIARALGHRQVIASHFLDNPASGRVLEKIGFEPTGRIVARHSCARGENAMTVEFSLDLVDQMRPEMVMLQSGPSQMSAA